MCWEIDGTHVAVRAPAMKHMDYYNRKGWYSIIVQGVVNHNYLFCIMYCGWPGQAFIKQSQVKYFKAIV